MVGVGVKGGQGGWAALREEGASIRGSKDLIGEKSVAKMPECGGVTWAWVSFATIKKVSHTKKKGKFRVCIWLIMMRAGHAPAYKSLGNHCSDGHGVPQSHEEAVKWFQLAADQGHEFGRYQTVCTRKATGELAGEPRATARPSSGTGWRDGRCA